MSPVPELRYVLLDEALIRYRRVADDALVHASLPQLLAALAADEVRDFPALRAHQRHPWHAFLVQLAAIALHGASADAVHQDAAVWRAALLALTPDDADGAAWSLVSPPDRPALLQAPVPGGRIDDWKAASHSADEIDMLVTSKNHDVKTSRMRRAAPDDWLYALVSVQTQEGFLGAGNYGISRMNGGFASRPGIGVAGIVQWGARWEQDVRALLAGRGQTAEARGLQVSGGHALVWLQPWDGIKSLAFTALDPLYIEICRRIRLVECNGGLAARAIGSKVARISAKELNGMTGDAWTPLDIAEGKALTITSQGFSYKLMSELMFGSKYQAGATQEFGLQSVRADERCELIAQGLTRGQGKTEGYHERRVPISPKVRGLLARRQKDLLALISTQRISAIGEVRKLLWLSLTVLFNNGVPGKDSSDSVKDKANRYARPFEQAEDARFFDDLNDEVEAADQAAQRLVWCLALVERADAVLQLAFTAGPRSAIQRYRAQAAAQSRFHGILRSEKSPLPELANHFRRSSQHPPQEESRDHA